ncbi:hypothetical protein [Tabrizicola sp.]|uniref:hypothetical protein n=1 Tax=Tabrizicola sp. TaxID=2005166 RepID=UPI003F3ACBBF
MAEKTGITLAETRIAGGVWEGTLSGVNGAAPVIEALHGDRAIEGVEVTPVPGKAGRFAVRVPIPAWAVNGGVQTFLVRSGGDVLAQFTLVAGQPLDEDIRAELSLLRAELELLKRAFRRHCAETGG